jgi:hypothetical protein
VLGSVRLEIVLPDDRARGSARVAERISVAAMSLTSANLRWEVSSRLESLARDLGISWADFVEMPIGEVMGRIANMPPYAASKWTRGELARIVENEEATAALEVCKYLDERGPRVIAWDDHTDPEAEELTDLEQREREQEIIGEERAK